MWSAENGHFEILAGCIRYLNESGDEKAVPLIPNLRCVKPKFYSSNHFRKIRPDLQEVAGVNFRIKDFRPIFAQRLIDRDPSLLPDISSVLGHNHASEPFLPMAVHTSTGSNGRCHIVPNDMVV